MNHSAPELAKNEQWQVLLQAVFKHTFAWLGFGAKTSVGYGAMEINPEASKPPETRKAEKWLQETLENVKAENIRSDEEAYASKPLAESWKVIDEPEVKKAIFEILEKKWKDTKRDPSKKAKAIYHS